MFKFANETRVTSHKEGEPITLCNVTKVTNTIYAEDAEKQRTPTAQNLDIVAIAC
jgi:hypothetical protein